MPGLAQENVGLLAMVPIRPRQWVGQLFASCVLYLMPCGKTCLARDEGSSNMYPVYLEADPATTFCWSPCVHMSMRSTLYRASRGEDCGVGRTEGGYETILYKLWGEPLPAGQQMTQKDLKVKCQYE
jgi:hypothetical protein